MGIIDSPVITALCILGASRSTELEKRLHSTLHFVSHLWNSACKFLEISPLDPLFYLTCRQKLIMFDILVNHGGPRVEAVGDLTWAEFKAMFLSAY